MSMLSGDVGFYSDDVKKLRQFIKIDVNVKNRTAVAGSVGFFKLE